MTSNYPKTPHVAQALVMAETLRELYPRGVPRQAANLLRKQHAEIERLRAEVGRLEAELLTKQRGQYVDGLFGRGGRS